MKKEFRIHLYEGGVIQNEIAILCAKNNGKDEKDRITIPDMEGYFKGQKLAYPTITDGMKFTPFINEFTIDRTDKDGDTICLLCVREIEVHELPEEN
jgi:hypothetical protein